MEEGPGSRWKVEGSHNGAIQLGHRELRLQGATKGNVG
jgi:hypothetical protein